MSLKKSNIQTRNRKAAIKLGYNSTQFMGAMQSSDSHVAHFGQEMKPVPGATPLGGIFSTAGVTSAAAGGIPQSMFTGMQMGMGSSPFLFKYEQNYHQTSSTHPSFMSMTGVSPAATQHKLY